MGKNNDYNMTLMALMVILFILLAVGQYKIFRSQEQLKKMVAEGILQTKELIMSERGEKSPSLKGR